MSISTAKYNPGFLSEDDLVRSFVVRHTDLELIVQVLRENVTDSNQHVLVTGARGSGKTTLALRVAAEIQRTDELRQGWYPIVFAEESYQVSTPGEFWLEALFHLAEQEDDPRWKRTHESLRHEQDETRLRESALAQLKDFADAKDKRLLLIVENFDMLLGDQIKDNDGWTLRHTLLQEPRIMLLATAVTRMDELLGPEKAMFDLFKPHKLHPLTEQECAAMWESITKQKPTEGRIRPIQILTGGNPRLVMIIASFAAKLSFKKLMDNLMQLVDEHTEYFKNHLDNLPPAERKVYLGLAALWKPATAREVAAEVRIAVSKTSAFLKRLEERDMVRVGDQKGRKKSYHVAERMYNIYYLMRRRAGESGRVQALVNFMIGFYPAQELVGLTTGFAKEACALKPEHRRDYLLAYEKILKDPATNTVRAKILNETPKRFFDGPDVPPSLKDFRDRNEWAKLAPELVKLMEGTKALVEGSDELLEAKRLCKKAIKLDPCEDLPRVVLGWVHERATEYEQAECVYRAAANLERDLATVTWVKLGNLLNRRLERYEEAEAASRTAIKLDDENALAWGSLGALLHDRLGRYREAEDAYRKAIELSPNDASFPWSKLGELLHEHLERYEEAEAAYRMAIELDDENAFAWSLLGALLHDPLGRYKEAEEAYRKSIELEPQDAWTWAALGQLLHERFERYEEAEKAYRKSIESDPQFAWAWAQIGLLLCEHTQRFDEAEKACRKAIELEPGLPGGWTSLGQLLHEHLERYEEAENAYRKTIELEPGLPRGWGSLGRLLHERLERYEEAEETYRKSIEVDPKYAWGWAQLGLLLHQHTERFDEAEEAYRKAIALVPGVPWGWAHLGVLLHEHTERYDKAEEAYGKAIELRPDVAWVWAKLGQLLSDRLERHGEAEKQYRKSIELDPKYAWAWAQLGLLLYDQLDRPGEAEDAIRKAVDLEPGTELHWIYLLRVVLEKGDRLSEAMRLAEDVLTQFNRGPKMLIMLAFLFSKGAGAATLADCEAWAREAVTRAPESAVHHKVLAWVLCAAGKVSEAMEPAQKALEATSEVEDALVGSVDLFADLAARGQAQGALAIVRNAPIAKLLEPLIVGLQLFLDEEVNVAEEILEVGKDVLERIRKREQELRTDETTQE